MGAAEKILLVFSRLWSPRICRRTIQRRRLTILVEVGNHSHGVFVKWGVMIINIAFVLRLVPM
jgi:hypothetical protein